VHLLTRAREKEREGGRSGAKVKWGVQSLLHPLDEGAQDAWSSANRALRSLEDDGLVSVEPPADPADPRARLPVRYYRLTASGRRAADEVAKHDPQVGPKVQSYRRWLHAQRAQEERRLELMLDDPEFLPSLRAALEGRDPAVEDDPILWAAIATHNMLQARQGKRGQRAMELLLSRFDGDTDTSGPDETNLETNVE